MLSAYVNDYHTHLDKTLPYVMQAYRSAEHETTSYTPNFLMLGRETTTSVKVLMSDSAEARSKKKSISSNELQLEEGRIYHKPTKPLPVSVPLKAATGVVTPPREPAADKHSF